jgi:enoyl-CoA hydratase
MVSLDRPAKLNAINSAMKAALASRIPVIARNPQIYAVVLAAPPGRMFSAGGDIREIYDMVLADPVLAEQECAREYGLIWLLDCFSKPTVALMDGTVMGTGAGIVQCATHRVAGPGYLFQMPETAIGYFPDNGVCWMLARLPGEIGTWAGLLGASIGRAEAFELGIVTHCIEPQRFADITAALAEAEPIDPLLARWHADPGPPAGSLPAAVIARCFAGDTVAEIAARLEAEREHRDWCEATLADLRGRSPLALEVTLQHIRRCRHLDLRQTLTVDYRLATRLVAAHDFKEGVRTRLIEKGGSPRWRPGSLADLDPSAVARLFEPLPEGEMVLPTRQEMQAARV